MAKTKISPALLCGEEQNISKKFCAKKLLFASMLIVVGAAIFFGVKLTGCESNSSLFLTAACISAVLVIWGCVNLVCDNKRLVYKNQSQLHGHAIYIVSGSGQEAIRAIKEKKWKELSKLVSPYESSAKIELVVSTDLQFARCQVLTYIPYEFQPLSDVIHLNADEAKGLLQLVK